MNKCLYLRIRSRKSIKYRICLKEGCKGQINAEKCHICPYKEYKKAKPIKKVSKKQKIMEQNRYSIFTEDLEHCIENKNHQGHIDKHEIFDGKNRKKSIKYGLVIPVCRNCHQSEFVKRKWQKIARQSFIQKYSEEIFIKEFQTRKGE